MERRLFIAALAALAVTACSENKNESSNPPETETYSVEATESGTWHYFSLVQGREAGTGVEKETDNAAWFARGDWDIAFNKYKIRTNSGEATTIGSKGGVIVLGAGVPFDSVTEVPAGAQFAADKAVTSSGMGGTSTTVQSEAQVVTFKTNEDGSLVMPPVYLKAPVCIFRTADGSQAFKVEFTEYQNDEGVSGYIVFRAAEL